MSKAQNTWDSNPRTESELTKLKFRELMKQQGERRKNDTFYDLGVFDRAGHFVGRTSLMQIIRGISHTAFLGYQIFNPYWGHGYAAEAVSATIDIAFRDVKLHRVEAGIEPNNKRSVRVAKKLKMRHEGVKRRMLFLREKWVDASIYSLTTEDLGIKFDTQKLSWEARS